MTDSAQPERRFLALSAALLVAIAFGVLHPVLGAGFLQDDWTFLAMSRHQANPLAYYYDDHSPAHFFRPHGMLSWWLLTRAFGLDATGHYTAQILLHAASGLALLWLLRRLGCTRLVAGVAAALFVVHPATVSTVSWLSDRFDLLATLAVLLGLGIAAGPRPARLAGLSGLLLAAMLAVGSKETGLLILPLVALLCLVRPDLGWPQKMVVTLAAFLPIPVWAGLRIWLVGTTLGRPEDAGLVSDAIQGIAAWSAWMPTALALDLGLAGAALACAAIVGALVLGWRNREARHLRLAAIGLGLLLLPALVQWPTTVHVFPRELPLTHTVNLRFFHMSAAGFAVLVALLAEGIRGDGSARLRRWAGVLVPVAAMAFLAPAALARATGLAVISSDPQTLVRQDALAQAFRDHARGAGCNIRFEMPPTVNLPGFADHVAKASLPAGHRAVDSLVLTDPMPWSAVVGPGGATPDALASLDYRRLGGQPLLPRATGTLYQVYMDLPADARPAGIRCQTLHFHWEDDRFVPAPSPRATASR